MILYFTGTGNSRFIAQQLASHCQDQLVSMNRLMRQRILDPYNAQYAFESDKPLVVVCPTYCWHIPRVVEQFLKESRFPGNPKLYFVLTCGSSTGKAEDHARRIAHEISLEFCGLSSIRMPENFITLFHAPEADEAVGMIRAAMPLAESIARQILSGRPVSDSLSGPPMPEFLTRGFYRLFVHDRKFFVKENCIGCTACAKLCPMVNITMQDGRPVWNGNCTQCQACIGVCPVDAIEFGRRTRKKRRYYLFADGRQKFPRETRPVAEPSAGSDGK
jgi:ferredoxin